MSTPTTTKLLSRCIRRPDGLILSRDHRYLPDAAGIFRTLVNHGVLTRIGRGAFVETHRYRSLPGWKRFDLEARAVGATEGRVLAGYSAAAVHGLWRYLSVPPSHAIYRRSTGGRRISTGPTLVELHAELPDHHVTTVDGETVTTIERTIVDLTALHGFGAGFVATCAALRSDIPTDGIGTCAQRRRGMAHLPLILEHATPVLESALEAIFLGQTVFFGGFDVIPQVEVPGENGRRYRVDFQVEGTNQFIELDGGEKYGADEAEQRFVLGKEKSRADELARAQVSLNRFGYRAVIEFHAYRKMLDRLGLPPKPNLPGIHVP